MDKKRIPRRMWREKVSEAINKKDGGKNNSEEWSLRLKEEGKWQQL